LDAHAFEKISLAELLRNFEPQDSGNADCNQLQLF